MIGRRISLLVVLLLSCLQSACAYYSSADGERLNSEVYALLTQVNAMQKSLNKVQEQSRGSHETLTMLQQELGLIGKSARRNDADFGVQVDRLLQELARVRGRVESFSERMSSLESGISKVAEETEVKLRNIKEARQLEEENNEAEKKQLMKEARAREQLFSSPTQMFNSVSRVLRENPRSARQTLREFAIRAKSKRDLKKYLPRAQFLIGESYMAEKNYQQAAAEYNLVRKKYPGSRYVADALYKLGFCFEKLNLSEDAKLFYQTVVSKYKKSRVAKDAGRRLKALK